MKKILIFSLAYHPRVGGAEIAIKEITDRIPEIEFHMITMRFSKESAVEERLGNVYVHRVGQDASYASKVLFIARAAVRARQLHAEHKFNAAWAMMSYMLLPLLFSGLRIPYALTLQEGDTYAHMFRRLRALPILPFINAGFRRASVVQAISTYLSGWARLRGFRGPLEIIPNGVNVKQFSGHHIPHDGVLLITTSRLVYKNALDDVIRSLPILPHVRFIVYGMGEDEPMLSRLARDLNVADRVEFRGHIDHDHLPSALRGADIFVRPSRSEGMGNSFIEAMAAGLPVIATQEGGLKDFIISEVAWPVKKDSPTDIARAVKDILGNPERTNIVVENARKMAVEKYDWDLIARDMREKVFSRVLHG